MGLSISDIRNVATQIRIAVRQKSPDIQLNQLNSIFKSIYPSKMHMTPHISGTGRTGEEFASECLLFGKSGNGAGRFRIYLLNDKDHNVHKITVKLGGTKYVLNYPSTASVGNMERFVTNVASALIGLYESR